MYASSILGRLPQMAFAPCGGQPCWVYTVALPNSWLGPRVLCGTLLLLAAACNLASSLALRPGPLLVDKSWLWLLFGSGDWLSSSCCLSGAVSWTPGLPRGPVNSATAAAAAALKAAISAPGETACQRERKLLAMISRQRDTGRYCWVWEAFAGLSGVDFCRPSHQDDKGKTRISPLDTVLSIRNGKACDICRPSCEASGGLQLLLAKSWSQPSPPKCRDCSWTLGCEPECSPLFLFLPLLDLARAEAKFRLPNISGDSTSRS